MLRTLIALDGSPVSIQMIDMAREVLVGKHAHVTLLHVVPLPQLCGNGGKERLVVIEGFETEDDRVALTPFVTTSSQSAPLRLIPRHLIRDSSIPSGPLSDMLDQERRTSLDLLFHYAHLLQHNNKQLRISCDSAVGDAADLILATADHLKATLLMIGSRRHNLPSPYPLGSVSYRVSLHAHCPVLVVHPKDNAVNSTSAWIADKALA